MEIFHISFQTRRGVIHLKIYLGIGALDSMHCTYSTRSILYIGALFDWKSQSSTKRYMADIAWRWLFDKKYGTISIAGLLQIEYHGETIALQS